MSETSSAGDLRRVLLSSCGADDAAKEHTLRLLRAALVLLEEYEPPEPPITPAMAFAAAELSEAVTVAGEHAAFLVEQMAVMGQPRQED